MKKFLSLLLFLSWSAGMHAAQADQVYSKKDIIKELAIKGLTSENAEKAIIKAYLCVRQAQPTCAIEKKNSEEKNANDFYNSIEENLGPLHGLIKLYFNQKVPNNFESCQFIQLLKEAQVQPQSVVAVAAAQAGPARSKEDIVAELKSNGLTVQKLADVLKNVFSKLGKKNQPITPLAQQQQKEEVFGDIIEKLKNYENLIKEYFGGIPEEKEYIELLKLINESSVQFNPVRTKLGLWQDVIKEAVQHPAVNNNFDVFWKKINDEYAARSLKMSQRGKYNLIKKKIGQFAPDDVKEVLLNELDEKMLKPCPVCYERLEIDKLDECKEGACGHIGHKACFDKWFTTSKHKKCPLCKQGFKTQNIKTAQDFFEKD